MRPFISIATSAIILTAVCAETKRQSYSEDGKTYYRPATITIKQLGGYASYSERQKNLTRTAIDAIPKQAWLKYKFGGASPAAGGFDCSGAMYYTLRKAGYQPPRTSAQQFIWVRDKGTLHSIPQTVRQLDNPAFKHLQPGDLLFWSGTYNPTDGRKVSITHVSMYLGQEKDGRHVMAGSSKGRSYRGKRGDGFGVFDFKLPRQGSRSKFVGYGTPPAPSAHKKDKSVKPKGSEGVQASIADDGAKPKGSEGVQASVKPNIIIIYGDDVGWGDLGCYGAEKIPTPHLDKLASQGLRFTDGHCSAATCTPSRFSMLTGIYGFRHNVRILAPNAPMKIKPNMFTLPQLFKKAGYTTAVIGKWHLGIGDGKTPVDWNGDVKPGPLEIGFDYSFLLPSTNDRVPCVYVENHRVVNLDPKDPLYVGKKPDGFKGTVYPDGRKNPGAMTYYKNSHGHNHSVINGIGRIGTMWGGKSALWNDETMADEFAKQARKYIASRKGKKEPFFLYWSAADIHVPRAPHPRFKGRSELTYRGDAMVQLDWCAGEIMQSLDKHGMTENTIVIFSSDNGPVYDDGYEDGTTVKTSTKEADRGHDGSGPWRGGKYQIYEGGTRVPLIIRWPAKIKPGTSPAMVSQIDFMASFAKLLEIDLKPEQAIDSRDNLDALLGNDLQGTRILVEEARGIAIRHGGWKYIPGTKGKKKQARGQLYNLKTDPAEQNNLIGEHPERARAMQELLTDKVRPEQGIRASLAE